MGRATGPRAAPLDGQRFNRLVVVRRADTPIGHQQQAEWICVCDCDPEKQVIATTYGLRSGTKPSCGCLKRERISAAVTRHGHTKVDGRAKNLSPTYHSWVAMKKRCYQPTVNGYRNYGGRGITVCDRWLNSFENFLSDMGERPAGTTLDRYPNGDGNYEPSNCRWATALEQAASRRLHQVCKRGHPLDEANTYYAGVARVRQCLICRRVRGKRQNASARAKYKQRKSDASAKDG